MSFPFVLLLIGFVLVFIEFFLPGAVFGIAGALLVLSSMVLFATQTDSIIAIVLFVLGAMGSLVLLIRFALWRVRHSSPTFNVYLDKDQEGYYASKYDETTIGKTGVVYTDLRPGGYVIVEGKKHSAISKSGYVPKNAEIEVIGGEEESLIVKRTR